MKSNTNNTNSKNIPPRIKGGIAAALLSPSLLRDDLARLSKENWGVYLEQVVGETYAQDRYHNIVKKERLSAFSDLDAHQAATIAFYKNKYTLLARFPLPSPEPSPGRKTKSAKSGVNVQPGHRKNVNNVSIQKMPPGHGGHR